MPSFATIAAFVIGAAFSFAVTRIANKLNGTDTLKTDFAYLKAEYDKLLARFNTAPQNTTPAAPNA